MNHFYCIDFYETLLAHEVSVKIAGTRWMREAGNRSLWRHMMTTKEYSSNQKKNKIKIHYISAKISLNTHLKKYMHSNIEPFFEVSFFFL